MPQVQKAAAMRAWPGGRKLYRRRLEGLANIAGNVGCGPVLHGRGAGPGRKTSWERGSYQRKKSGSRSRSILAVVPKTRIVDERVRFAPDGSRLQPWSSGLGSAAQSSHIVFPRASMSSIERGTVKDRILQHAHVFVDTGRRGSLRRHLRPAYDGSWRNGARKHVRNRFGSGEPRCMPCGGGSRIPRQLPG